MQAIATNGTPYRRPELRGWRKFSAAVLAARTAFKRIMDGFPVLAMDAYSPQELDADRTEREVASRRYFERRHETSEREIADLGRPADYTEALRFYDEAKRRYDATASAEEIADDAERRRMEWRGEIEADKLIHVRQLLAEMAPETLANARAALEILANQIEPLDEGEFWAMWVRHIRDGIAQAERGARP
jgi:hypothetical protein